ncbi:MAG: alpha/beta fold hydrolase [Shimia sp.]
MKLAVWEDGPADAPALLFIHGWSQCHLSFAHQAPLAERFRLILPDLRGHGESEKPEGAEHYNSSEPWAGDIAAILDHFALDRPVVVGWSMGGWITLDYLRSNGDARLAGLMQIGTSVTTGRHMPEAVARFRGADPDVTATAMYGTDLEAELDATVRFVCACFHVQPDQDDLIRMVGFNMRVPGPIREACRRRTEDYRAAARATHIPVAVLWGSEERLAPDPMGEEAVATFPNATTYRYDGFGHAPFWEAPERFNADLATFAEAAFASGGGTFGRMMEGAS